MSYNGLTAMQKRLVSGGFATALGPASTGLLKPNVAIGGGDDNGGVEDLTTPPAQLSPAGQPSNYQPASTTTAACATRRGANVKVNQDCATVTDGDLQGRGQSQNETSITHDPNQPDHLVASYNDYRRGDGNCYGAYSRDGGRSWSDTTIPTGFTRGTAFGTARQYWQAGGDTSVAFDTKGNAYFSCQVFNRGSGVSPNPDQSSAFYVFRSTGNGGASWNFPGRPVRENSDPTGVGAVLEDKQLMTVDAHKGSPFQDRVYVSWTEFAADGSAYIYEAHSADYGEHFSSPVLVSTTSAFCDPNSFGVPTSPSNCNENQFSQPFTGSDGALYITYANFNNQNPTPSPTSPDNRYQVLLVRSTDGGATFGAPVKVGDYYDLPDCATYQAGADAGRSCVPEKNATTNSIFRAANYPVGAVDPTDPAHVVVTYASYINSTSKEANGCAPAGFSPFGNPDYTGVKTAGACNNGILISESQNAAASFTGSTRDPRTMPTVNPTRAQGTSDQFWQWADFSASGQLAVSYYDRQYGSDEATGYSDISVSTVGTHAVSVARATSSSMPPPTGFSGLFFGDYSGMTVVGRYAMPLWSDTRDPELFLCPGTGVTGVPPQVCTGSAANAPLANDQDAFTTKVALSGGGH
ncbi:MAG: hypothetical protein QOJ11_1167 [Frankiales bacterium]|nr:hypothetical protein [Frankiales bacterium]